MDSLEGQYSVPCLFEKIHTKYNWQLKGIPSSKKEEEEELISKK